MYMNPIYPNAPLPQSCGLPLLLHLVTPWIQLVSLAGILTDLVGLLLSRSCVGDHSSSDFRTTMVRLYPYDISGYSSHPPALISSQPPFPPLNLRGLITDVPFRVKHGMVTSMTSSESLQSLLPTAERGFSDQGWEQVSERAHVYLEGSLSACSFSKTTAVGSTLGPMAS